MQAFFSQGVAVLCSQAPDLASLRYLMERHGYTITKDEEVGEWPEMQGSGITLATDFDNGSTCLVDICEFPWPDDMGNTGDPTLLTNAHALGGFGPFVFAGAFERALQAPGYQSITASARDHRAFVRFRISGLLFANSENPEAHPKIASPADEHLFLLRAAASLVEMPGTLAYFNPNSELLLSLDGLVAALAGAAEHKLFPIEAVCRFRGCLVDENWSFVDSIGMAQLGRRDHEFAWPGKEPDRKEQMDFLFRLLCYEIGSEAIMADGHTTDGPHEKLWCAEERESSCMMPPRKVLHWTMNGAPQEPPSLAAPLTSLETEEDKVTAEMMEIQAKIDAWLTHRDAIRARASAWLSSPEFRSSYYDDAHMPPITKVVLEGEMSKKEARETWQKLQYMGQQSPELWRQYQQLGTEGQVWLAVPLMVNPMFKQEVNTMLPCGVVVATEQNARDIMLAGLFAQAAYSTYIGESDPKEHPGTARMLANDEFRLFYREMFPVDEVQGMRLLYMGIMLRNSWMPPKDVPFIPLLAMPGPQGAVIQIPWHVVTGTPPLPDSVKPGRFADIAAFDRQTPAGPRTKKRGCWDTISLVATAIFLAGILGGVSLQFMDKSGDQQAVAQAQPAKRQTFSNVSSWSQTSSLRSQASIVDPADYEPLIGENAAGSGFIFKIEAGFILAATSRHQFGNPDQPPRRLIDLDGLAVSLNTEQLIRQPDSQIQLVEGMSKPSTCLEYRSSEVLQDGDTLRLVLGKDRWIEGKLEAAGSMSLSSPPALLRLQVQTSENVAGTSGSPIVHAKSGLVVGVMIGADKAEAPKFLIFETLRIVLVAKETNK